jgi:uncharacterized protein
MAQVVLFVIALFAAPWIVNYILGVLLPPPSGSLLSFLATFVPVVWTPTILALLFVAAADGAAGVKRELKARLSCKRGALPWLGLAAVLPILAVAAAVFSAQAAGGRAPLISADSILPTIGVQMITGAIGEELGWRGFLLSRLRRFVGVTASFWIMGVLWSLWHLGAFFDPKMPHYFMPMMLVLPFIAFFGVFLGFVFNRAGESVLATMTAHLSLNIMTAVGGASLTSSVFWGVLASVFGVAAVLITVRSAFSAQGTPKMSSSESIPAL